jgi:hypothetical protein
MSSIAISASAGPAFCVHKGNALARTNTGAITGTALDQINPPLLTDVTNGTVNVLTQVIGLTDLTGQSATGFSIGVLDGIVDPAKGAWPANSGAPEDWNFLADGSVVNMGVPTGLLTNGKIAGGTITAGPSTVQLTLNLAGVPAVLQMNNATMSGTVPKTTTTPGDLPANMKVEAGLEVFDTITASNDGTQGLCGDVTVSSLAQIPVPSVLTSGIGNCSQGYTYCGAGMAVGANCNSLLDVIVGGCSVAGGFIVAVQATQPDVPGNGKTVQKLNVGGKKKVTVPANDTDAYSAYLTFAMERMHFSGESCTGTAQCQTGQTCTAGVCKPQ